VLFVVNSLGQTTANKYGLFISFHVTNSEFVKGEIASNYIKVINNTAKERAVKVQINPPSGWRKIGSTKKQIVIAPYDSIFIPVRISPKSFVLGGKRFVTTAVLYSENVQMGTATWNIENELITDWTIRTSENKVYFDNNCDTASFNISVINKGNTAEVINFSFFPSRQLSLLDNIETKSIILPIDGDTVIKVRALIVADKKHYREQFKERERAKEKYTLKIRANSGSKAKKYWKSSVDFFKVEDSYKENISSHESLPLTVDLQTYNIFDLNPYATVNLFGNKNLGNQRELYYNLFLSAISGSDNPFSSDYQYLAYRSPKTVLQLGTISYSRSGGLNLFGKGVAASQRLNKNHTVGVGYLRSPKIFMSDITTQSFGLNYDYNSVDERYRGGLFFQRQYNFSSKINRGLLGATFSVSPLKGHRISLQGGYSQEFHGYMPDSNFTLTGFDLWARYSARFSRKINGGIDYHFSSNDYAGTRGVNNFRTNVNWNINSHNALLVNYSNYRYTPNLWSSVGLLRSGLQSAYTDYKLTYRNQQAAQSVNIYGQYYSQNSQGFKMNWSGGGVNYVSFSNKNIRWQGSISMGINNVANSDVENYFNAQFRIGARYKNFNSMLLYYFGPNYLSEHVEYARTLENPRTFYFNTRYEWWPGNSGKVLVNVNANFNYRTIGERMQVSVRPDLVYFVAKGFKANFYILYNMYSQGEQSYYYDNREYLVEDFTTGNFEVGIGITKEFGIPISKKKNFDITFVAFNDLNGNGVKDINEVGIENMLIKAEAINENPDVFAEGFMQQSLEVITNQDGKAFLINVTNGAYDISSILLHKVNGWASGRDFELMVNEDCIVNVPFSRGGNVSGAISMEADQYSRFNKEFSLANIRISAVDSLGYAYSCLTDENGVYSLAIPYGKYHIVANSVVFGESFTLNGTNNVEIVIDENNPTITHAFYVKEKSRKISIKKFGESGEILSDTIHQNGVDLLAVNDLESDSLFVVNDSVPQDSTLNVLPEADLIPIGVVAPDDVFLSVRLFSDLQERKEKIEFEKIKNVECFAKDSAYNYYVGDLKSAKTADKLVAKLQKKGFDEALVIGFVNGVEVAKAEAVRLLGELNVVEVLPEKENDTLPVGKIENMDSHFTVLVFPETSYTATTDEFLKVPKEVQRIKSGEFNNYLSGDFKTLKKAQKYADKLNELGFDEAKPVALENGIIVNDTVPQDSTLNIIPETDLVPISIVPPEATFLTVRLFSNPQERREKTEFKKAKGVKCFQKENAFNYYVGDFVSEKKVDKLEKKLQKRRFSEALVVGFSNGKEISKTDALKLLNEETTVEILLEKVTDTLPIGKIENMDLHFRVAVFPETLYAATTDEFSKVPKGVLKIKSGVFNNYLSGEFKNLKKAQKYADKLIKLGFDEAKPVALENGIIVPDSEIIIE